MEEELPVWAIFDPEYCPNKKSENDTNKQDFYNYWEMEYKDDLYVSAIAVFTGAEKIAPSDTSTTTGGSTYGRDCRQAEMIVGERQRSFVMDTDGLLVIVWPLKGAPQTHIPGVYPHIVAHACHYSSLWGYPGGKKYAPHDADSIVMATIRINVTQTSGNESRAPVNGKKETTTNHSLISDRWTASDHRRQCTRPYSKNNVWRTVYRRSEELCLQAYEVDLKCLTAATTVARIFPE